MIHCVYAVFDSAAKAFLPPFCLRNDGEALRAFRDVANSGSHQIGKYPEDYTLFLLGTFNDSLGEFIGQEPGPKSLGSALAQIDRKIDDQQLQIPLNNGKDNNAHV